MKLRKQSKNKGIKKYTGHGKRQLPFADQNGNCRLPTAIEDSKNGNAILWQLAGKTANFTFF